MKYSSSYELKKSLKRMGYDLEGLQVKQATQNGFDFTIEPLDTSALYDPSTGGFRNTSANLDLVALLNELSEVMKDTNVLVGLTKPTSPATINP